MFVIQIEVPSCQKMLSNLFVIPVKGKKLCLHWSRVALVLPRVVGRMMPSSPTPSKNIRSLSLEPVNVTFLKKKRVFPDVIKLRALRWGDDSGLSKRVLNEVRCILLRERQRDLTPHRREGDGRMEQKDIWRCWSWRLEWCGHKPRNASTHWTLRPRPVLP